MKTLADSLDVSAENSAADAVTAYLAGRRALLALDNLEQLDGAGRVVAALLTAAPGLVVLATSRGPNRTTRGAGTPSTTRPSPNGPATSWTARPS